MFEDEELMEILCQNDDLMVNNNKTQRRPNSRENSIMREPLEQQLTNELFIHEDEMVSWLTSYPMVETTTTTTTITNPFIATTDPPPPTIISPLLAISTTAAIATTVSMFTDPQSSISITPNVIKNSTTVLDSNETPAAKPKFNGAGGSEERTPVSREHAAGSAKTRAELPSKPPTHKRKEGPTHDMDIEDVEIGVEVPDAKRQVHGTPPTKRCRTAEVHNLSERRRRNKLNEKMKTLQDLIPCCNKTDKASILDDAIEYMKSLQHTLQMMSMGYGMMPMMYPGMQMYVPPMTKGMSVEPVTNLPTLPYPLWGQVSSEHFSPRFQVPGFHMPPVSLSDQHISQGTSPSNLLLNLHGLQSSNEQRISTFNPYQHYHGINQAQVALAQNQAAMHQSSSTSKSTSEGQSRDDTR